MPDSSAEATTASSGRGGRGGGGTLSTPGTKDAATGDSATSRAEEALRSSLVEAAARRAALDGPRTAEDAGLPGPAAAELVELRREALSAPAAALTGNAVTSRKRFGVGFWLACAWIGLVLFAAVFCNLLPLPGPNQVLAGPPNSPPSWQYPFGTDLIGHDIFSQVVYGARISMIIGISSVVVGIVVGGGIGVLAGFYRGAMDVVVVWITDVLLTLPGLILALTLVAFLGQSLGNVILAIDLLTIPAYARIARATSLAISQRDYVLVALSLGSRPRRILLHDVVPLVALPIASYAAIGASIAILAEGALAYLGLSAPNAISWGDLIAAGQQQLQTAPWLTFAPMAVLFLTILALNYMGQQAGAALDPRPGRL